MMNQHKRTVSFGSLVVLGSLVSCTLESKNDSAEPLGDPLAHLDPVALAMAVDNQEKLEAAGLRLVGRAWFGPDAYGEIYEDADGSLPASVDQIARQNPQVLTFAARGASELATRVDLRPQSGETFDAYVERTSQGKIATRFNARSHGLEGLDTDVLLFRPRVISQDGYTGSTQQALSNQFCPKSSFDAQCSHNYGFWGDAPVNSWYVTDRGATSFSGTGTSGYGVGCADAGDVTMSFTRDGSTVMTFDVAQGFFNWAAAYSGWSEHEYCASHVIICVDYRWKIQFGRTSYSVSMKPKFTIDPSSVFNNGHFCGSIRNRADYTQEFECSELRNCPGTGFVN
ncbi:MAG TPA: hypothetical protein VFD36_01310 [Kofleriaceae bacterium]|nr:hypothetical protein [Kofleriaceae bacterium]